MNTALSGHCRRWNHSIQPRVYTDLSGTKLTVPNRIAYQNPQPV